MKPEYPPLSPYPPMGTVRGRRRRNTFTDYMTLACTLLTTSAFILYTVTQPTVYEALDISRVLTHLRILDRIVDYHNGTRAAGTSGYNSSALYVTNLLTKSQACDTLEKQYFTSPLFEQLAPSYAAIGTTQDELVTLQEGHDFLLVYGPSASFENISSVWLEGFGCPFVAGLDATAVQGKVVVIDRPSLAYIDGKTPRDCSVNDVASYAHAHGAAAVVLANSANDTELWPLDGWLDVVWITGVTDLPKLPIISVDWVAAQLQKTRPLSLTTSSKVSTFETFNLLCTWNPKDPLAKGVETLVIGAHLDSVPTGPGIVDNGSGSMTILEWATTMRKSLASASQTGNFLRSMYEKLTLRKMQINLPPERKIIWAWWGAEEIGLVGSRYFASQLNRTAENVVAAINVDMIASPNGIPRVMNASYSPAGVLLPSMKIQKRFQAAFHQIQEDYELGPTGMMSSDDWSFLENGVPTGGLLNGASKVKTQSQRMLFGGMAGAPLDPCYHSQCDTFENINVRLLHVLSRVGYQVTVEMAEKSGLKSWLWEEK